MSAKLVSQRIHTAVNRVVYFAAPKWLVYLYVIALILAYLVVVAHTPLTLYPGAPHDDGLFMSLGRSLAEGHWLGRYSEFTLTEGAGYPVFLATANGLGISASLADAVLLRRGRIFRRGGASHYQVRTDFRVSLALLLGRHCRRPRISTGS